MKERDLVRCVRLFALVGVLGTSLPGFAQTPVIGDGQSDKDLLKQFILNESGTSHREEGFLSPSGRFRVRIPKLEQADNNDPDTITFNGETTGGTPFLLIFRRVAVTPGASPAQLMLVTRDRFIEKLPGFTVLRTSQVKIAGRTCSWMMGRYQFQGNRGYPQIVENAYVVDGADGFIIHSEIAEQQYNDIVPMLNDIYKSFKTITPQVERPVAPPPPKPEPTPNRGKKKHS